MDKEEALALFNSAVDAFWAEVGKEEEMCLFFDSVHVDLRHEVAWEGTTNQAIYYVDVANGSSRHHIETMDDVVGVMAKMRGLADDWIAREEAID